jgi:hypothetical protein
MLGVARQPEATTEDEGMGVRAPVEVQPPPDAGPPMSKGQAVSQAWLWVGILIVVTVVAGLVLMQYRRRVLSQQSTESGEGFMESLRTLRANGEMSEDEFQSIRRKLLAQMAGDLKSPKKRDEAGRKP